MGQTNAPLVPGFGQRVAVGPRGEGQACLSPPAPAFEAGGYEAADAALIERLAGLLSPTPVPRDELVRLTGAAPAAVYAALVELAVAGRAELLAGGMVVGV